MDHFHHTSARVKAKHILDPAPLGFLREFQKGTQPPPQPVIITVKT